MQDGTFHLPRPDGGLDTTMVSRVRGEADALALRLRHHKASTHATLSPSLAPAREVFDALEQARCEAIGARRMSGVAENLDAALTQRCTEAGYLHLAERADAPLSETAWLLREGTDRGSRRSGRPLATGDRPDGLSEDGVADTSLTKQLEMARAFSALGEVVRANKHQSERVKRF